MFGNVHRIVIRGFVSRSCFRQSDETETWSIFRSSTILQQAPMSLTFRSGVAGQFSTWRGYTPAPLLWIGCAPLRGRTTCRASNPDIAVRDAIAHAHAPSRRRFSPSRELLHQWDHTAASVLAGLKTQSDEERRSASPPNPAIDPRLELGRLRTVGFCPRGTRNQTFRSRPICGQSTDWPVCA